MVATGRRARAAGAALTVVMVGLTAALAVPAVGAAEGEAPGPVKVGTEAPAEFRFGISPTLLPARDPGSTELELGLEETSFFGPGVPPGIEEARFGLDRSIDLEPGDLPVCRRAGVNAPQDAGDPAACRRAVVGHVEATIEVAFAEAAPVEIPVAGKVYNGGRRRAAEELLVELPVSGSIDGVVWAIAQVRPAAKGRIGSEMTLAMPTVAGGSGLFLDLRLAFRRGYAQDGARVGYVGAECPEGKLEVDAAVAFTDGSEYEQKRSAPAATRVAQVTDRPDSDGGIVRSLGPHLGVAFYDPIVALVMRERRFRGRLVAQVLAGAAPGEPLDVVELGCGTGTNSIRLAAAGAHAIGVDADPEILERARRKQGAEAVDWRAGRVEDPGLPAASCDRVVLSLVLHHLPDEAKLTTLESARRLLRPGGRVHVADWGLPADPLMRLAFAGLQRVDGKANTQSMADGKLPAFLAEAGFTAVTSHDRLRTGGGLLELTSGVSRLTA